MTKPAAVPRGANMNICERAARALGATVEPVPRTGEIRFSHPRVGRRITVNGRRKGATRAVIAWINELAELINGGRHAAE